MINYLLDPFIQIENSNGQPVVGAKIYVYYTGSRTLAPIYTNKSGTSLVNPAITDTLGNVTIFAKTGSFYDVLVYDNDGTLLFSKINVTPSDSTAADVREVDIEAGFGIQVHKRYKGNKAIYNVAIDPDEAATQADVAAKQDKLTAGANIEITNDNTINVVNRKTLYTQWPLKVDRGSSMVKFYLDSDYANDFKSKQTPVEFGGANGQYISYITQNANGEIDATVSETVLPSFDDIHEGDNITITRDGNDLTISSKDWTDDIVSAVSEKLDTSTFDTYVNNHVNDDITPYTAGTGISISNHQISCTGDITSYTAGTGISISNHQISCTGDITPYTAGTGISISNHVISISSSQEKHSNRLTTASTDIVSYDIAGGDNFAIGIEYDKTNSKAYVKVYNYAVARNIYVSLNHSSSLTPVAQQNNGTTIVETTSTYNLYDLDIMFMGVGGELPVCSFTIAIAVNSAYCEYTVYDKMIYSF